MATPHRFRYPDDVILQFVEITGGEREVAVIVLDLIRRDHLALQRLQQAGLSGKHILETIRIDHGGDLISFATSLLPSPSVG